MNPSAKYNLNKKERIMRIKEIAASFAVLLLGLALTGCAGLSTNNSTEISCTTRDTNAMLKSGEYRKKVDNFLIIQDASSSMGESLGGFFSDEPTKLELSKDLVRCLNDTLPNEFDVNAGMRIFGPTTYADDGLIYGMTQYSNQGLDDAVLSIVGGGNTPVANALTDGANDLSGIKDRIAVILFSDGLDNGVPDPVAAAASMKEMYGDNICIYTVLIGDSPEGRLNMEQIAAEGKCGFATEANNLSTRTLSNGSTVGTVDGMGDFVTAVFLEKGPSAPAPMKKMVDLDSDGDGVPDSLDQCPNTPKGIKVDRVGCPFPIPEKVSITLLVEFDFDKAVVKPQYHGDLQKVANFLKAYPDTTAELEGHTDSIGSDEYNMKLSQRRAASVKKYLVEKLGIDAARLSSVGYGESRPVASNKTDEGRQKNRRVVANVVTITMK
jgi:OOP family OmpA-OmpF porin